MESAKRLRRANERVVQYQSGIPLAYVFSPCHVRLVKGAVKERRSCRGAWSVSLWAPVC